MKVENLIHQKSYEKIQYILRRHPVTFMPQLLLFLALFAAPIFLYGAANKNFPGLFSNEKFFTAAVLMASVYALGILVLFFAKFVDFYLDVWILTNDRVIDIEQFGLFSRTISELDLFRIQDVTTDVHGVFATFLNYGNVSVKTASSNLDIVFRNIPNPDKIRQELHSLADVDRKYHYAQTKNEDANNEM